ncbi:hypothetical protein BO443_20104 [Burkholderia orbicola]
MRPGDDASHYEQAQERGLLRMSPARLWHMARHDTDRHNAAIRFLSGINRRPDGVLPIVLSPDIQSALIPNSSNRKFYRRCG